MPSIVFCLLLSCSLLLCCIVLASSTGRPPDLFPLLGCHSVQRLVHLLSFVLASSVCFLEIYFPFSGHDHDLRGCLTPSLSLSFLSMACLAPFLLARWCRTRWPSSKVSASRVADLGSIPAFTVDLFSRSSHASDWRYRVSTGTGWSGVSIL